MWTLWHDWIGLVDEQIYTCAEQGDNCCGFDKVGRVGIEKVENSLKKISLCTLSFVFEGKRYLEGSRVEISGRVAKFIDLHVFVKTVIMNKGVLVSDGRKGVRYVDGES